jgi:cell division protein FtsW
MQKNIFKNYWRNIDKSILTGFFLLFFLGIFFSFASTSFLAGERLNKDYYFFFSKHFVFACFSIFLMIFISHVRLPIIGSLLIPVFIILLILLILVPLIGVEVKGSKRWLNLFFFRLQPIELIKPFFILIVAKILSSDDLKTSNTSYFFSFLVLLFLVIFLANQPDIGQSILLIGTWVAVVFVSGISLFYIFSFLGISLTFVGSLLIIFPNKFGYITKRLEVFLDPSKGDSVQSQKALDAIKEGGLTGQGMGEGILKYSVPEAHTDYIISVITEEFGSIISILLISIFLFISFKIIKKTILEEDKFLKISLCGLSSILIFQTFIHIGVNAGLLPTTGMTLPFLSYGGSSMIGSAILAGIILNFTKKRFFDDDL